MHLQKAILPPIEPGQCADLADAGTSGTGLLGQGDGDHEGDLENCMILRACIALHSSVPFPFHMVYIFAARSQGSFSHVLS